MRKSKYKLVWYDGWEKSYIALYKDDLGLYWLSFIRKGFFNKNKFRDPKIKDTFLLTKESINKIEKFLHEWQSDGDYLDISCGCAGNCCIIRFIIDDPEDTRLLRFGPDIFIELYIHAAYKNNIKRNMASEVVINYDDLGEMLSRIEINDRIELEEQK